MRTIAKSKVLEAGDEIKQSKYAPGKNPENLTKNQRERLELIQAEDPKIKLLIRIAYGFRDIDTMIGLIMLFCSSIEIPWPGRTACKPAK